MSIPTKTPLKVGVLLVGEDVQLLDVSPVDLLGMMEPHYIRAAQLPEPFPSMATDIEYYYITETGEGPKQLTGGMQCEVTVRLELQI